MPKINFTDKTGLVPELYYPKPSKAVIPSWFKELMPRFEDESVVWQSGNKLRPTGKRCVPMMDSITAGYTIFTSEDIIVSKDEQNFSYFEWARRDEAIKFHKHEQLSTYPSLNKGESVPKWENPWVVKTPPGYSCLFTQPMNNPETPIKIFSGIVDTDSYIESVNFPFQFTDRDFSGLVPAGTPIAQVIPFARESWKMELNKISQEEMSRTAQKNESLFWDKYRRMFWNKKDFS
jgi:hypothetical protein